MCNYIQKRSDAVDYLSEEYCEMPQYLFKRGELFEAYNFLAATKQAKTGGENVPVKNQKVPMHGFDCSITMDIPAMSTIYLSVPAKRKTRAAKETTAEAQKAKSAAKRLKPQQKSSGIINSKKVT